MLKLLTEYTAFSEMELILETSDLGRQIYKIKGPFLQANIENRNKRKYLRPLCEREVTNYQEKIIKKRSMGELDHPPSPTINLDRVSHLIESLHMDGDNGIGVAKLLDTPKGIIAQTLVKEGILLGVSTRGVGTLSGSIVNDDYKLITIDIVADPSAPGAFVDGILENKEFIIDNGGQIVEFAVDSLRKKVDKNADSKLLLSFMKEFLNDLNN